MSNKGSVLTGKDTYKSDATFIFDKVINLQFIRKGGETFTLRSDYEVVNLKDGTYYFQRMQIKPEIKIDYEQVAENTAINVRIQITNFHMFGLQSEKLESLSAVNNPIQFIKVQLGYFSQFPNFASPDSQLTITEYNSMSGSAVANSEANGVKELTCQVLAAYPTKMPPDSITMFDCVVASIDNVFHTKQLPGDATLGITEGMSVEKYLFNAITKRYARCLMTNKIFSGLALTGGEGNYVGAMSDSDANLYGVKCILSNGVKGMVFKNDDGNAFKPPAIPQFSNVSKAFYAIQRNVLPTLRFFCTYSGDYVVFLSSESANEIVSSVDIKVLTPTDGPSIPAIYSQTFGAVRSISCPFYTLLNPFQKIEFSSRYNTANMVGYYYQPESGNDEFYSIRCVISFSTVGDENEMLITSVDA